MATPKPKILLVDDVDFLLDVEKDFLARTPAEILTAGNGTDALRLIHQERPQLVYLDVTLPDISGTDCCRQIKADPFLRLTPIVLIFASMQDLALVTTTLYGCDEVLAKPLERKAFLNCGYRYLFDIERRGERIPCHIPVHCQFEHGSLESNALDVSSHGIFVQSRKPVLPGTRIAVSFNIPAHDATIETIEGHGRVAWVNQGVQRSNPGLPQGFGVHLMQISSAAQSQLTDLASKIQDSAATRYENSLLSREKEPVPTPNLNKASSLESKKESDWTEH